MIKPQWALDGKPFHGTEHSVDVGRRGSSAALPFSEKGSVGADVGRKPRVFNITAFVLGENYRQERDDLLAVIETAGVHLLKHPDFGRISVRIWTGRSSQTEAERRKATITFTAEEAFDQPTQTPSFDVASAVKKSAAIGIEAAGRSFENPLTGLKRASNDFVAAAHLSVLDDVIQGMRSVNGIIANVLSVPSGFASQIDTISRQGAQLLGTPRRLFNEIEGTLAVLAESARRLGRARRDIDLELLDPQSLVRRPGRSLARTVATLAGLGENVAPTPRIDTALRREQAAGALALQRHMQTAGLLHWAAAASDIEFDSRADAALARDAIVDALVRLSESEPDLERDVAQALRNAAAALSAHLTASIGALPTIVQHIAAHTIPAEVLAWHLYGDASRAEEIVVGNLGLVPHPTFIPGGHVLEVKAT